MDRNPATSASAVPPTPSPPTSPATTPIAKNSAAISLNPQPKRSTPTTSAANATSTRMRTAPRRPSNVTPVPPRARWMGGTADALVAGFRSMAYAALLIGFARAIFVTLEEGRIVDTIVHGLFTPLARLPLALAALGMMVVHGLVHVPVPSPSGHAVLTLPILVPLADLLGLSRQVTVLAYQYGGGLCELFTPTNGALLAILAAA